MWTHLPEKVRGTNLRDIKSDIPRVIYAPGGGVVHPEAVRQQQQRRRRSSRHCPSLPVKEVLFFLKTSGSTNKTSLFQLEISILRSWAYNAIQVSSDIISSVSMLFSVTVSVVQITSVCVQN